MREKRIRNTLENEKGQSLVEFALVVPILLLLMFAITEFGRAWMTYNILTGAAREAVRDVVVFPGDMVAAKNRGLALATAAGVTPTNITFGTNTEADGTVTRSATASHDFTFMVWKISPGLGSGSLTLTSTAKMRREYTA